MGEEIITVLSRTEELKICLSSLLLSLPPHLQMDTKVLPVSINLRHILDPVQTVKPKNWSLNRRPHAPSLTPSLPRLGVHITLLLLPCFPSWRGWHGSGGQRSSEWASSVKAVEVERPRVGWPRYYALMISLASPKKKRLLHSSPLILPPSLLASLLCSLPPSGALTKETWLSQRPAADLLIHSLCPFYVLLQTYLQRGRRKREEGGFGGRRVAKTWSQHELCCDFFCSIIIKCLSTFRKS